MSNEIERAALSASLQTRSWQKRFWRGFGSGDKTIWIIAILLFTISMAVVFSATSQEAFKVEYSGGNFYRVIFKHFMLIVGGALLMSGLANVPTKYFIKWSILFLLASIVLLLYVQFAGLNINGSKRWIKLLGFTFQPSEIAKIALINYVAVKLRDIGDSLHDAPSTFYHIMGMTMLVCFLIFLENISTSALLFLTIYVLCWLGGANRPLMRKLTLLLGGLVALVFVFVFVLPDNIKPGIGRTDTGSNRITNFIEKIGKPINSITYNDVAGRDYQVVSAQKAIANSNFWGVGAGNSELRQFLPQAFSDYVYNVIVEEYGILGAASLLTLYLVLFFRLGKLARRTDNVYQSLVLMGVGLIITLQAVINMAVAANLLPVTGQPLPFVSRGGTSYIITASYFGLVLSITNEIQKQRERRDAEASGISEMPSVEVEEIPVMEMEEDSDE